MIICPYCNEEIEEGSNYCDQCGKQLSYCSRCGQVGTGKCCTHCGAPMVSRERREALAANDGKAADGGRLMPQLLLVNNTLGISLEGVNGAIIGRRQGPYRQTLAHDMYVSGVHAQLFFTPGEGWQVADKHSSNGSALNGLRLEPDKGATLHDGDVLTLADLTLHVVIK